MRPSAGELDLDGLSRLPSLVFPKTSNFMVFSDICLQQATAVIDSQWLFTFLRQTNTNCHHGTHVTEIRICDPRLYFILKYNLLLQVAS